MCCPAGFSSMLVQGLYHLGSVHPEKLRSCWTPQKPFCFWLWEQAGPWLTDTRFQQIFTSCADLISFVLLIGMDIFVPQLP